jgi:heat shock protein HslJ
MSNCNFATFVILATLAAGCAGSSSMPTSPSSPSSASGPLALNAERLAGTWNLLSIEPAGQAQQATPPAAAYSLTLQDGRLTTLVDCNRCSGAFTLSGQTLTAGPALACTRAACPTMAFENAYTGILSGESTVTLAGDSLVVSSSRGVLRFARQ